MPSDKKRDYEVGYGRPPRHTRSRKGQSGNPKGRQRGAQNLPTPVGEALNERVVVTENGGRRKISKRQALFKQMVNQALKANWRAAKLLLDILVPGRVLDGIAADVAAFDAGDRIRLLGGGTDVCGIRRLGCVGVRLSRGTAAARAKRHFEDSVLHSGDHAVWLEDGRGSLWS
jgi:hypothetical protein